MTFYRPKYPLIQNIHENFPVPTGATDLFQVQGNYKYFHYFCDNFNDFGWGCGFRVLQTICSWIDVECAPLSVQDMIALLDEIDGSWNPTRSRTPWIGTFEGFLILDHAFDVSCRIIHIKSPSDFDQHYATAQQHFVTSGAPIFLGGNKDCFGKCILGICQVEGVHQCLILDPHFTGTLESAEDAHRQECLKWISTDELTPESFYNLLLPVSHGKLKHRPKK